MTMNVPAMPGGYIHDHQQREQAANDLLMQGYRRALPLNNPAIMTGVSMVSVERLQSNPL